MMHDMKHRISGCLLAVMGMLLSPAMLLAQEAYDARLEGYPNSVTLGVSTMFLWLIVALLAAGSIGVMFKSAGRTHMD